MGIIVGIVVVALLGIFSWWLFGGSDSLRNPRRRRLAGDLALVSGVLTGLIALRVILFLPVAWAVMIGVGILKTNYPALFPDTISFTQSLWITGVLTVMSILFSSGKE